MVKKSAQMEYWFKSYNQKTALIGLISLTVLIMTVFWL